MHEHLLEMTLITEAGRNAGDVDQSKAAGFTAEAARKHYTAVLYNKAL